MISAGGEWIFVHIQRTGGNSIRAALGVPLNDPDKHRTAAELRQLYGSRAWDAAAIRFAFVRNPWDRLVSWWSLIDQARSRPSELMPFQRYVIERARTFEEFLLKCDTDYQDIDGSKWIYRNQVDYLIDADGRYLVDFIGRHETLEQDFALVASAVGRPELKLPHVNRSSRRRYEEVYSPTLRDLVGERYARDISAFEYAFGQDTDPRAG